MGNTKVSGKGDASRNIGEVFLRTFLDLYPENMLSIEPFDLFLILSQLSLFAYFHLNPAIFHLCLL